MLLLLRVGGVVVGGVVVGFVAVREGPVEPGLAAFAEAELGGPGRKGLALDLGHGAGWGQVRVPGGLVVVVVVVLWEGRDVPGVVADRGRGGAAALVGGLAGVGAGWALGLADGGDLEVGGLRLALVVVLLHLVVAVGVVVVGVVVVDMAAAEFADHGLAVLKGVDGGEVVGVGGGHLAREGRGPLARAAGAEGDLVVLWRLRLLLLAP